ncbi:uncharacterized protein LOC108893149 [Lates japonicus]
MSADRQSTTPTEHLEDVLQDEDVTFCCSSPAMSEESVMTYATWCSITDSDISEMNTPRAQDLNEVIRGVCQSFVDPEYLEYFGDRDELLTTETGFSSRFSIRSEESERPASSASSFSTTTAITEAAKMLVSQVTEEAVRTLQSTKAVRTLQHTDSASKAKRPAAKSFFKKLKSTWKSNFSRKQTKTVKKVSSPKASSRLDLTSTPLEIIEEEDTAEKASTSPSPSPSQVDEASKDFQEEERNEVLMTAANTEGEVSTPDPVDSASQALEKTPSLSSLSEKEGPGPSEEDGHSACSPEQKGETAEPQLVLNSSTISPIIRRFFESLTEEQWREVNEGVYNQAVKEKLINMCTDVLKFVTDLVIKMVLQSIRQPSVTSGAFNLIRPRSLEHLKEFLDNIHSSVGISLSQAICDTIGADVPVRISTDFTAAVMTEVISVLSVARQAPLDGGSSSAVAPARCQVPKDRAAEKTLAFWLSVMKSFLTGQSTVVKRRIVTQKDNDNKEETPTKGHDTRKKKSLWKRCFSGRQRIKTQPLLLEDLSQSTSFHKDKQDSTTSSSVFPKTDLKSSPLVLEDYVEDEDMTPNSPLSSISPIPPDHQEFDFILKDPALVEATTDELHEDVSQSSQSQPRDSVSVEETGEKTRNSFCSFLHKIFSKDENKKETEKEEKTTRRKRFPLWKRLLFCRPCSCCFDQ